MRLNLPELISRDNFLKFLQKNRWVFIFIFFFLFFFAIPGFFGANDPVHQYKYELMWQKFLGVDYKMDVMEGPNPFMILLVGILPHFIMPYLVAFASATLAMMFLVLSRMIINSYIPGAFAVIFWFFL
jgi:hypothetical protein